MLIAKMLNKYLYRKQLIWLSKKFCEKYDIDINLFREPSLKSGPYLGRDNYQLYCSLISLKWLLYPTIISTLSIVKGGRFSNSLQQLCYSLLIAQKLKVKRIIFPDSFWYLPEQFFLEDIHFIKSKKIIDFRGVCLEGQFHKLKTLLPVVKGIIPARYELAEKFIKHFSFDLNYTSHELAIHIRSGDIFLPGCTHPYYGQPPLAYYLKILNCFNFSNVAIVYEDLNNPVIPEVIKHAKHKCNKVDLYHNGLDEAIRVLLNAQSIVAGLGTFIPGIVAISKKVENVFVFNNKFNDWGKSLNLINIKDVTNEYHSKVTNKNWRNTPEQLSLMMSFPEEKLKIDGMLKSQT
jgi:hypothetical protein